MLEVAIDLAAELFSITERRRGGRQSGELKNAPPHRRRVSGAQRADTSCVALLLKFVSAEIIRLIDGPLAPFGDAEQLRSLIDSDLEHRALYKVFMEVRNAAAKILEHITLADIVDPKYAKSGKRPGKHKHQHQSEDARVLPMVLSANPRGSRED